MTRRSLARQLGVTVPAASTALEVLCEWGLLGATGGPTSGGPGRRPEYLDLNPDWGHGLVFYPADTRSLCTQQVDWSLRPVGRPTCHAIEPDRTGSVQTIRDLYESVASTSDVPIRGLGVVRTVDLLLGWALDSDPQQRRRAERRAQRLLQQLVSVPAVWVHSYHARALGEYYGGGAAATGRATFGRLHVGHGISLGLFLNGQLVEGATGDAGEMGHFVFETGGAPCRCGRRGCLETLAAGWALANRFLGLALTMDPFESHQRHRRYVDALASGDARARELAMDAADAVGQGLAAASGLMGLDLVILGGEVATHAGPEFIDRVRQAVGQHMPPVLGAPEVRLSESRGAAIAIGGAAALFELVASRTLRGGVEAVGAAG